MQTVKADSEGGRLKGLTNHLLSRHSFYLLYPPVKDTPVDLSLAPETPSKSSMVPLAPLSEIQYEIAKLFPSLFGQPSTILVPGESNES
ncbi:hypothetical protein Lser_V15G32955 [Lactuca serriola]